MEELLGVRPQQACRPLRYSVYLCGLPLSTSTIKLFQRFTCERDLRQRVPELWRVVVRGSFPFLRAWLFLAIFASGLVSAAFVRTVLLVRMHGACRVVRMGYGLCIVNLERAWLLLRRVCSHTVSRSAIPPCRLGGLPGALYRDNKMRV